MIFKIIVYTECIFYSLGLEVIYTRYISQEYDKNVKCQLKPKDNKIRIERSCLKNDWWSWFDLQYPSIPQGVKGRVGVVSERGSVKYKEGRNVVQDEAELIRVETALGSLPFGVDDARSQTCHHRVIHHSTNL